MEYTSENPLNVKMTCVSHPDGSVTYHVVLNIEGAKVVFDRDSRQEAVDVAVQYLVTLRTEGERRLRSLLK